MLEVTLVFIALKLLGVINIAWIYVFTPLWVYLAVHLLTFIFVKIFCYCEDFFRGRKL
jgi:hypothetical protein